MTDRHRKMDVGRVVRDRELRCGWAVPLRHFTGNMEEKARKRFIRHVLEDGRFVFTHENGMPYLQRQEARRIWIPMTGDMIHSMGIAKKVVRACGLKCSVTRRKRNE
jgi:hypothetical protein